ncbi:phosphoribosylaminoimidazolesuccinocarboxamide synthase [Patescibacteria group bacterium]|nr:phosphoribosylaminoimidazolesuccinocarboxamide synthase [Patescibacteria group bacterium]
MSQLPKKVKNGAIVESLKDKLLNQGKVRDIYDIHENFLLMLATDRISIFDFVLPATVPRKGEILTALTHFWLMHQFGHFLHHLVNSLKFSHRNLVYEVREQFPDIPLERSLVVSKTEIPPYEMIFRYHLGGSAWTEYKTTGIVAGQKLPMGLVRWSRLNNPLFTPSTKSESEHDANISVQRFYRQVGKEGLGAVEMFRSIYKKAYRYAAERGIVILDTKFEGLKIIADEVLTPDSSRFTTIEDWQKSIEENREPIFYDKELVRQWGKKVKTPFSESGKPIVGINNLDPTNPQHVEFVHSLKVPQDIIRETARRYKQIFKMLTGVSLKKYQTTNLL